LFRRGSWRPLASLRRAFAAPIEGRPHMGLTKRIIALNAVALVFLIGGVLTVESHRVGLVDERLAGIRQQAQIVASTLAEYTTDEERHTVNLDEAEPLLSQLIAPTPLRARLYGTDGSLELDTRNLLARNVVEVSELPALDFWSRARQTWNRIYDGVMGVRPFSRLEPYLETGNDGRVYREVNQALNGEPATAERVDERNRLVLSVAVPVQRFKAIYGALLVSTEGGDIDSILRGERATLIEVFLVALIVMLISSLYLAGFIAEPIHRLAAAADRVRGGRMGREVMPSMPGRQDEIGDLAKSLSEMTRALYERMDAIESFAADVAHELKNPLTSLRSATDMLRRASDEASREQLMQVVRNDVRRIDRLITDISDASRLDAELSREPSTPVDLGHLLATILEVYRVIGLPRGITLETDLPENTQIRIMGRDERLGQVFRNIIDNAISFSPDNGKIAVAASTTDKLVRVTIKDEGQGIPPDNLETIFKRFYTERPHEQGFGKNSGLGLSIARQIVQGHGGRVWAENCDGAKGARFVIELPLAENS
jgi:two-component system sensor histidine kinase ChvG